MSYFKASYQTLKSVSRMGRYEDLAAFLVLARHANGRPPPGIAPYRLSGAGINAVHEKAAVSEETARGAIQRLKEAEFISPASAEARKASYSARWEIRQAELDLDLPHLLSDSTDAMKGALRRIRALNFQKERRDEAFAPLSDSELQLDVLMTLLAIYRHTSMTRYGGLSPLCSYRSWTVHSRTEKSGGMRWGAEPETLQTFLVFMGECIVRSADEKPKALTEAQKKRFWLALDKLQHLGLIYEAVSLFDVDPAKNNSAQLLCTLRVNDYHAGSAGANGDPSLLRALETDYGAKYSFYTHAANDRGEPEAMWLILPKTMTGTLTGVWRPRFRTANMDTGSWFAADSSNVDAVFRAIVEADDDV